MRFTVFGGAGFIGRHLVDRLREAGHQVLVPSRDMLAESPPQGGYGTAIWAIGLTANFRRRPFDTVEAHVAALLPVLRAAAFDSFLYLSSTRVYQRNAIAHENTPILTDPSDPSDLYNLSKLAGEALCLGSGSTAVRVARLSNIVGPGEAARDTFLGALCREARAGSIQLQSAPSSTKDYLWIDDAAESLIGIATNGQHRLYNVASGRQIRHSDWLAALSAATGAETGVIADARDTSFPPIDVSRLQSEFAFAPADLLARIDEILAA